MRVRYDTHSSLPTMVLTNRFKGSGIRLSQLRWGAPLLYMLAMNLRPALDVTFIEAHRRVRPAVTFVCIASIRVTPPPRNSQQTLLAGQSILQFNALRVKEVDYMLETERLTLRAWAETDAESLYAYAKDPDIGPIAGWSAHRSKEESLNTIRHVLNGKECYAICERGSNNPIGSIELKLNGHTDMTDRDDEREAWSVPWKSPTIRTTMPIPSYATRWCSFRMLWKGLGGFRTDAGQDPLELHDVFLDATDDVNESFIVVTGWIWQIPIIVESLADIGTSHVAAHGDRDIRFRNIRNQFGVLRFLHVDAVKLFHESYGILIDLRLGLHACGIKIKIGSA